MIPSAFVKKGQLALAMLATHGFPWHRSDKQSSRDAHRLRAMARRLSHAKWPSLLRPFAWLGAVVCWPLFSYREASLLGRHSNPDASPSGLVWKAWRGALRHNVPAAEYGAFGLWNAGASAPDSWLYTRESALLTAHLMDDRVSDLVGHKVKFAEFCEQNTSHAVTETLAVFQEGVAIQDFTGGGPPEVPLVSKPVRTSMGRGFERWEVQDRAFTSSINPKQAPVPLNRLSQALAALSLRHPSGILVQRALSAHPALAHLSEKGPPVSRIVTGRWQDGRIEVLNAMLQKPNENTALTHGGPFRLIDIDTGETVARSQNPHLFPSATNNEAFDGLCLPDWYACTSALIQLHAAIEGQAPLLGWDVVFTPEGPTILEANTTLAPYFFQLASQAPAGNGKWVSLLAEYLP